MTDPNSFSDLSKVHEDLDRIFFRHQEALLRFDLLGARSLLASFQRSLASHLAFEEKWLLPLYRAKGGDSLPGGKISFYLLEHRKLKRSLVEIRRQIRRLLNSKKKPASQDILELLDREYMFKHLMRHHDLRERNILYRFLDSAADSKTRIRLLNKAAG